jgi:hypothetical protein
MSHPAQPSKARRRFALAKAKDITRRQQDLDTCLVKEHQVALAAALAEEYAELLTEYPDVFPDPPVSAERMRAHAQELREAQAAHEEALAEEESATRKAALNDIFRIPKKPEGPS